MWHVRIQNQDFIVSRLRNRVAELVDSTGKVSFLPDKDVVGSMFYVHKPILRGFVPFTQRPRSFVSRIRVQRMIVLEENRKTRKVEKSDGTAKAKKAPTERKPRKRKGAASPETLARIASLPPELQLAARAALGL